MMGTVHAPAGAAQRLHGSRALAHLAWVLTPRLGARGPGAGQKQLGGSAPNQQGAEWGGCLQPPGKQQARELPARQSLCISRHIEEARQK